MNQHQFMLRIVDGEERIQALEALRSQERDVSADTIARLTERVEALEERCRALESGKTLRMPERGR